MGDWVCLLNVTCHISKYAWSFACTNNEASTVKAHLENITFDEDQVPTFLKCYNGLEFKNQLIKEWAITLDIEILYRKRYTPTDQGAVEAYNKTILRDLKCYKTSHPD